LIRQDLVDEYYIFRRPVAIGNGLSIFKEQRSLALQRSITYKNGTMLNTYLPVQVEQ
jgi:riboflavin biosynthesis pyrimidine reductase